MKQFIGSKEVVAIFGEVFAGSPPSTRTIQRMLERLESKDRQELHYHCVLYRRTAVVALAKRKAKKARKK